MPSFEVKPPKPKKSEFHNLSIYVTEEAREYLVKRAKESKVTLSTLVRQALKFALPDMPVGAKRDNA